MGALHRIGDGLQSLATRLGTSQDKAATASYSLDLLDEQKLEAAFRTSWIIRKVVQIPAMDATRKWREWSGEGAQAIEDLEAEFQVRTKVAEAKWKARLFGGSVILIGVGDQDLAEPLDRRTIRPGDLRYLTVLSRREIQTGLVEIDPRETRYGLPRYYEVSTNTGEVVRVHPTRVAEFMGEPRPTWASAQAGAYGWGDSVLQSVYTACQHLDMTMANIASLVFDAKTDIIKLPGMQQNLSDPRYEDALLKRMTTTRMVKGNNGMLLLDKDDEYDTKSYSFGGLSDIADRFMQVAAGAADIPLTRLLGRSPGGLNSTGDADLNNYHDKIQSIQLNELQPAMKVLDEVLVRSALGDWPEDVGFDWRPLKQMTEDEISTIRNRDADTLSKLSTAMVYGDDQIAEVGAQMFRETGVDALGVLPDQDEELLDAQLSTEPREPYVPPKPYVPPAPEPSIVDKALAEWLTKQ